MGLSVALSAGYYFLMTEVLQKTAQFQANKLLCIGGLLGGGFILWILGILASSKPAASAGGQTGQPGAGTDSAGSESFESSSPSFLSLPYLGCMMMVFGIITVVITPSTRTQVMTAARSMMVRRSTSFARERGAHRNRALPPLKLQGIIYKPSNPSAVINGKPTFIGETISGAKVTAITMHAVTLAYGGSEQVLTMRHRSAKTSQQ